MDRAVLLKLNDADDDKKGKLDVAWTNRMTMSGRAKVADARVRKQIWAFINNLLFHVRFGRLAPPLLLLKSL